MIEKDLDLKVDYSSREYFDSICSNVISIDCMTAESAIEMTGDSVVHLTIKNLPRTVAVNLFVSNISEIAVTQQSQRRVRPKSIYVDENSDVELLFAQYSEYNRLIKEDGLPLEESRRALSVTTPCNIFITCSNDTYDYIVSQIYKILPSSCVDLTIIENCVKRHRIEYSGQTEHGMSSITVGDMHVAVLAATAVYDKSTNGLTSNYLASIVDMGHFSILEHIPVIIEAELSVDIFTQLIRHRHREIEIIEDNTVVFGDTIRFKMTTNVREMINLSNERVCVHAQKEIRLFATKCMLVVSSLVPVVEKYNNRRCMVKSQKCLNPCKYHGIRIPK